MAVAEATPDLLFDESAEKSLAEIYAPCFTLILHLRSTDALGDPEMLRNRIKGLLDQAQREALQAAVPGEDIREAKFAIVAFIDEAILSSDWPQKDHWLAKPLQKELFERYDAGEEFFTRLETLREQSKMRGEVLEIYYLCMALGFKGKHQIHGQEKLRHLIEDTYRELRKLPGRDDGQLSPHGKPRDQVATEVRSKLPTWVIAVATAALCLLVYLGLSLYISGEASEVADTIRAYTTAG